MIDLAGISLIIFSYFNKHLHLVRLLLCNESSLQIEFITNEIVGKNKAACIGSIPDLPLDLLRDGNRVQDVLDRIILYSTSLRPSNKGRCQTKIRKKDIYYLGGYVLGVWDEDNLYMKEVWGDEEREWTIFNATFKSINTS